MANAAKYRVLKSQHGHEPQMLYTMGTIHGKKWFPLNSQGYWLEPDAFTRGQITKRNFMPTRSDADRVIAMAKLINSNEPLIRG